MGKIRVMVVDEHAIVRKGVEHLLENQADMMVVGEAATGREALEKSRVLHSDVVLLAIALPDLSGLEVTGMLRKEHPKLQIVIFSAQSGRFTCTRPCAPGLWATSSRAHPATACWKPSGRHTGGNTTSVARSRMVSSKPFCGGKSISPISPYERLSAREQEVFRMLVGGKSTGQIAELLYLSPKTVEKHRGNIMRKLGYRNLVEMVKYAISIGITD